MLIQLVKFYRAFMRGLERKKYWTNNHYVLRRPWPGASGPYTLSQIVEKYSLEEKHAKLLKDEGELSLGAVRYARRHNGK